MFTVTARLAGDTLLEFHRPLSVDPRLRGFAEESDFPVAGDKAQTPVSISALAHRHCPTGRDLYLDKKLATSVPSWERYVIGRVGEALLNRLYVVGVDYIDTQLETDPSGSSLNLDAIRAEVSSRSNSILAELMSGTVADGPNRDQTFDDFAKVVNTEDPTALVDNTMSAFSELIVHEIASLIELVDRERKQGGDWVPRLRVALLQLQTVITLDTNHNPASRLGISRSVRPDFLYGVSIVGDTKVDFAYKFYDVLAAGYAIFAEYALGLRVNYAALFFVELDLANGRLTSAKVRMVKVDDTIRRLWITQRDSAQEVLRQPELPQLPADTSNCSACPYNSRCWPSGIPQSEESIS